MGKLVPRPEHKWEIHVSAGADFDSFAHQLGGNDIFLSSTEESNTGRLLSAFSYHADQTVDPTAAATRIYSLEVILNGAIRVANGDLKSVPIRFLEFDDGFSRFKVDARALDENPFSNAPFIDQDLTNFRNPTRHGVSHLIFLAKKSEVIRTILLLAGLIGIHETILRIHSWNCLFRIFETIESECGKDKLNWDLSKFGSTSEISKFKAACNNMCVLGIYSRHGLVSLKPRPKPITAITDLETASKVILSFAREFLRKYIIEVNKTP